MFINKVTDTQDDKQYLIATSPLWYGIAGFDIPLDTL